MSPLVNCTAVMLGLALLLYVIIRAVQRDTTSDRLQAALATGSVARVRAILIAQRRWLDRDQIRAAAAFVAAGEIEEERVREQEQEQEQRQHRSLS